MTTKHRTHPRPRLLGRTDEELAWHRRRSLLQAAAWWLAAGGFGAAQAQARSNIVELRGEVRRNGEALAPQHTISTGDRIETGPGASAVFAVGDGAFLVRQNSNVALEGEAPAAVKVLRLVSGAVASVWGRGADRKVILPTATAGIRGTGVYAEVFADQGNRGYFCNCYGTVDLATGNESVVSETAYHQSFWVETAPRNGRLLTPAGAINHTDEELEFLASLIGQRTAWQAMGRKGARDGSGQMGYPAAPGGGTRPGSPAPAPALGPSSAAPPAPPSPGTRPPSPYGSDY